MINSNYKVRVTLLCYNVKNHNQPIGIGECKVCC